MTLFTIGYGNSPVEEFLACLHREGVEILVDVRSRPSSRQPAFNGWQLKRTLIDNGLRYEFMGDKLGGIPDDAGVRRSWKQGALSLHVVEHLRGTEKWRKGVKQLALFIQSTSRNVCLLCSESNPEECHRKALALDIAEICPGLEIRHLRVSGNAPKELGLQRTLL